MAKIIIHKGFISLDGQIYKAGEIVTVADANCAKRMVARSDGDFDFYHGQDIAANAEKIHDIGDDGEEGGGESEWDNADSVGLPAVDAAAAVQTAKHAKGKKR